MIVRCLGMSNNFGLIWGWKLNGNMDIFGVKFFGEVKGEGINEVLYYKSKYGIHPPNLASIFFEKF